MGEYRPLTCFALGEGCETGGRANIGAGRKSAEDSGDGMRRREDYSSIPSGSKPFLDISIIFDMLDAWQPVLGWTPATPRLFHALSDETRLSILERLRFGERCVCDLTDALDAAQSRLSFHLKVLKDAGLVTDRRDGRWMYYTLNQETLSQVAGLVETLASTPSAAERKNGCC
jgi:ArsR family transcriptional regulator, arsenate/arsenite/antimonite-responsive transcriptional repressor